jgi:hypothetical protein
MPRSEMVNKQISDECVKEPEENQNNSQYPSVSIVKQNNSNWEIRNVI